MKQMARRSRKVSSEGIARLIGIALTSSLGQLGNPAVENVAPNAVSDTLPNAAQPYAAQLEYSLAACNVSDSHPRLDGPAATVTPAKNQPPLNEGPPKVERGLAASRWANDASVSPSTVDYTPRPRLPIPIVQPRWQQPTKIEDVWARDLPSALSQTWTSPDAQSSAVANTHTTVSESSWGLPPHHLATPHRGPSPTW
ncbi:hypothetical protein LIA77_11642 [Sarocladium implicatum]|nr:hypothetical protein LIA77_11642 [Sarocladium implicatum]